MASTPTNHWKVGLFVVSGVVLMLCALVYLGVQGLRSEHVLYHTYFDEPVQGLDIGSPIQFRGVKVGQVADIRIAPDRRHVEVHCALFTKNLRSLGLREDGDVTRIAVPPELRIQLTVTGLTGLKALQIDFFDPKRNPPPALPFKVPDNYIPAAMSTLTRLQASVTGAVDRVPEIADALMAVAARADRLLVTFEEAKLAQGTAATLSQANRAFASIERAVDAAAVGTLSKHAQKSIASLDLTIQRANAVLARLDGDNGVVASVHRTSNAIGDIAASSPDLGEEVTSTLRELQEAAASFRRLTDALERNPEMLLKGRARGQ